MEYWEVLAIHSIIRVWLGRAAAIGLTEDDVAELQSFDLWLSEYLEEA